MNSRLIAGAMSGTSADGVDVAIVRITGTGQSMSAELLRHHHLPYSADLRATIFAIREKPNVARPPHLPHATPLTPGQSVPASPRISGNQPRTGNAPFLPQVPDATARENLTLAQLAFLAREISLAYAAAVNAAASGFPPLDAIAAHGQTLFHAPPLTLQWLDPSLLAALTRTPVVSDFRRADCAAGGQGAPLVPFADFVLFRDPHRTRVLLNIGGIANLTYLPAGGEIDQLIAFDTGPGNCISDSLMRPQADCDPSGQNAARGQLIPTLLDDALKAPFFTQPPPKSTDGPAMISIFHSAITGSPSRDDLLHTACHLSARTIGQAIDRFCPVPPDQLIISGGGVHNQTLMNLLRENLPTTEILTTDELGLPSNAKEAVAFALLGAATLDNHPSNVPSCTGASAAVVLGSITPAPRPRKG
jgi:anhydro-N-acetylmuramic acid kinase